MPSFQNKENVGIKLSTVLVVIIFNAQPYIKAIQEPLISKSKRGKIIQ
jgi:hypothetical protein